MIGGHAMKRGGSGGKATALLHGHKHNNTGRLESTVKAVNARQRQPHYAER
jgi:hypothetical protein